MNIYFAHGSANCPFYQDLFAGMKHFLIRLNYLNMYLCTYKCPRGKTGQLLRSTRAEMACDLVCLSSARYLIPAFLVIYEN